MKIEIIADWEIIEQELTEFNKTHCIKVHSLLVYQTQLYSKLDEDQMRDLILAGIILSEECSKNNIKEFLKLLKIMNS